ncbi:hypothetical protein ACQ4PT_007995 [Festuca glaucescens]
MASGVDRISALPDDVLHHVLGFLPAQEVVRTCVLARRWRGVWRSVPALRFTGAEGWDSADRFAQFVDQLLLHLCTPAAGSVKLCPVSGRSGFVSSRISWNPRHYLTICIPFHSTSRD